MAKRAYSSERSNGILILSAAVAAAALLAAFSRREPAVAIAEPAPSVAPGAAFGEDDGLPQAEAPPLRGQVRESIDVADYTYLRLATPGGEVWAAVSRAAVPKDREVTILDAARMERFTSTTLKRTFDVIYFGRLSDAEAVLPPNHPQIADQPRSTEDSRLAVVTVPHATGKDAFDISEIHAQRRDLAGRRVKVSGRVVKVTSGVMGKNYVRLRDGSGSSEAQRELVITCQFEPKVGDLVTVEGTLRVDVDLGIGVVYPVLVEDASPAS